MGKSDPIATAVTLAQTVATDLAALAKQQAVAELQRVKAVLTLDERATRATQHLTALALREPEASALLAETAIAAADATIILEHRPGLAPLFEAVEAKRRRLEDLVLGTTARLTKALARYATLTPDDLTPPPPDLPVRTPLGVFAPVIWRLYEALSTLPSHADVDEALRHLTTAFAELRERLQAPAVVPPLQPLLAMQPKASTGEGAYTEHDFVPLARR